MVVNRNYITEAFNSDSAQLILQGCFPCLHESGETTSSHCQRKPKGGKKEDVKHFDQVTVIVQKVQAFDAQGTLY